MSLTTSTLAAQKRLRIGNFMIALNVVGLFVMVLCYAFLPTEEAGIAKYSPFLVVIFNLGLGFVLRRDAGLAMRLNGRHEMNAEREAKS